MLMRFKDSPEPPQPGMVPPGSENKVMHANFRIGDTEVMASDGRCMGQPNFQGFSLPLTVADDAEVRVAGRRPAGANAPGPDLLFLALRHGGQPLRRVVDGTDLDAKSLTRSMQ